MSKEKYTYYVQISLRKARLKGLLFLIIRLNILFEFPKQGQSGIWCTVFPELFFAYGILFFKKYLLTSCTVAFCSTQDNGMCWCQLSFRVIQIHLGHESYTIGDIVPSIESSAK